MVRIRRVIGVVTLLTLVVIVLGVTGFQLPLSTGSSGSAKYNGVKALNATTLLHAPAGGELAFMAVEPSGNLVVSDAKRASVLRFDPTGHLLTEWGPNLGNLRLTEPAGVAVASDGYYVLDRGTPRIIRLDASGLPQAMLDLQPLSTYGLNGLALDAAGNIYAADTGRNRILVFSPSGQLLKQVGHGGSDLGGFTQPMTLAFAPDGSFYVPDWENQRIERFNSAFDATDAWSLGFHAFGVAVDQSGRIYAPDVDHRRVEVFTPQGASLGEISSALFDVAPRQLAMATTGPASIYILGSDAIQRIDLADTPPPPQGTALDSDLVSVLAIVLMLVVVALAVLARRRRRSFGAAFEGKVGLHAKNGTQRQQEQAHADEDLLITHQTKREQ